MLNLALDTPDKFTVTLNTRYKECQEYKIWCQQQNFKKSQRESLFRQQPPTKAIQDEEIIEHSESTNPQISEYQTLIQQQDVVNKPSNSNVEEEEKDDNPSAQEDKVPLQSENSQKEQSESVTEV